MKRTILVFTAGLILGGSATAAAGYAAGFERHRLAAPPEQITEFSPPQQYTEGRDNLVDVERRTPRELQECVQRESAEHTRRQYDILYREIAFGMERALGKCLSSMTKPRAVAQK
jgi:hypothetical protein